WSARCPVERGDGTEKVPDAGLDLAPHLRRALADIERRQNCNVVGSSGGMASGLARLVVDRQKALDAVKRIDLRGDIDRQAHPAGHREGLLTVDGDTDRRMRLLDRLGNYGDAFDIEEAAVEGDPIAGPGLADDLEPLNKAIAILGNRNTEGAK